MSNQVLHIIIVIVLLLVGYLLLGLGIAGTAVFTAACTLILSYLGV